MSLASELQIDRVLEQGWRAVIATPLEQPYHDASVPLSKRAMRQNL
jgi:hypothetical protein